MINNLRHTPASCLEGKNPNRWTFSVLVIVKVEVLSKNHLPLVLKQSVCPSEAKF